MIYGRTLYHPVRDSTDLIGIRTLILRRRWTVDGTSVNQADIDAAKPAAPPVPGGLMLMGDQTVRERGCYATFWTFQGVSGDGSSVTFKDRTNSIDYGFAGGFAQVPVQVVKNFMTLLEKFQGYPSNDGTTVIWPPTLATEEADGGGSPLEKTDGEATGTNPMFGIQTAFEMEGIYRFRYASRNLPQNLFSGVGYIAVNLPGQPPRPRDGRNWLMAVPEYDRKGNVFDITEYYWLSRRGGWPAPLYKRGYLGAGGEDGGDAGPTTTTGVALGGASEASL